MAKKLGTLVKEARTEAGMSQTALAAKVEGLSAADIGKIERGEKIPSQAVIKSMAKALGVTQASLLNAYDVAGKSSSSKTSSSKTTSSKTSSSKTTSSGKTSSSGKKASSSSSSSETVKLTATEKKLLTAYRKADASTKKAVLNILEGNGSISDILTGLFSGKAQNAAAGSLGTLLEGALGKIKK